ncbi:hypothetical protein ACTWQB_12610 [Piscibacillus sp. B03]
MPCGKNETSLAPSQLELFLSVIEHDHTFQDIRLGVKLPVFKVKSALRELEEANFIEEQQNQYFLTEKGRGWDKRYLILREDEY